MPDSQKQFTGNDVTHPENWLIDSDSTLLLSICLENDLTVPVYVMFLTDSGVVDHEERVCVSADPGR
jgi:hypothetical protein